jgi:nucleotide-binding universal stress UspA family protein
MPGTLVCGIEELAGDVRPLSVARGLSERLGLRLVAIHVAEPGADPAAEASARRMAEQAADAYITHPADARIEYGNAAERLAAAAVEEDAELLVVGSRGAGRLNTTLLGSVSVGVVAAAPCPVVVVSRGGTEQGPRRGAEPEPAHSVVCGVDGSEESYAGANLASDLAARLDLRLLLAHVMPGESGSVAVEYSSVLEGEERSSLKVLHRAVAGVSHRISPEVRLERGDPADRLDDLAARESAELIVVGSRGLGKVRAALLGSVAGRLAGTACAPVTVLSPHVQLSAGSGEYEFREAVL